MTETKTFAQRRLMRLRESYKETKHKQKLATSTPSSKGNRQSGNDSNKKACPKRESNSKTTVSPIKVNEKYNTSSILKNLNKNGLSSNSVGMECQHVGPAKDISRMQQRLKSCRPPQNLKKKSSNFEVVKQPYSNPPSSASNEAGLKNLKKFNADNEVDKGQQNLVRAPSGTYETPQKRRSDHENLDRKKITKNKKFEDSSKNLVSKKSKNDLRKESGANTLGAKLSLILDSYTSLGNDSSPPQKGTSIKTEKNDQQVKESFIGNRKRIQFTIPRKKDADLIVKDKEREIKDKGKMKQVSVTPQKTKLQARLQKVMLEAKDKKKETRKESTYDDESNISSKDDNSHFIESMDWEPSNDLILRSNRDEVDPSKEMMEWQYICNTDHYVSREISGNSLYLVVDTNVLIRNIELIKKLSQAVIRGFKIIQVIPWQVLKELDNLKSKVNYENVNVPARKVIRFLSEATNSDQFNVVFQSQSKHFEECNSQFVVEVPDDHLIKCCFQLKEKRHNVLLLSNDLNLRIKTNTSNIQAVDSQWISNILNQESKSIKQSIHCFETEPKESQRDCVDDNSRQFTHKTTGVILSSLYNIVLLKYKEKYDDLWPLWVPKEPHFPEIVNFMTSSSYFQSYWIKLNLIKDFFIKNKSYDDIKPANIEKLGRNHVSLLKSMCSDNYIPYDLALQAFKDLGFLKCFPVLDWSNFNYVEGSYKLAEKYLKDTEDSLNEFVAYLSALFVEKGLLLYRNEDVLHHIKINLKLINEFKNAIMQFQLIQEQIPEESEIAKSLHKAICDFLGDKINLSRFPIFSPEDIVEYVNPNRNIFIQVVSWLMNQESALTEIKSKLA